MTKKNTIAIVFNAHLPYINASKKHFSTEELPYFLTISETLLSVLEVFERLEADSVPFKLSISFSPMLFQMLTNSELINNYISFLDKQILFGEEEQKRTKNNPELFNLVKYYCNKVADNKKRFTESYHSNLLNVFSQYQKKGFIEIVGAPATNCFLPLYSDRSEAINAQLRMANDYYKSVFNKIPKGLWLPELGWHPKLEPYIKSYDYDWTVIDTHAALLSSPAARYGSYYPIKTKLGTVLFIKDFYAYKDIMDREEGLPVNSVFRDYFNDAVDELPLDSVISFLTASGRRTGTGFKYHEIGKDGHRKRIYDPEIAAKKAKETAEIFLESRILKLNEAATISGKNSVCVCTWNMDFFGRFWYEGPVFLENLFRKAAQSNSVEFMTPSGYLLTQDIESFQVIEPEFSSAGLNGYAESFIDSNNDWAYRHISRALTRMSELAERFNDETGIKERCLNQAARELLLALSSDWPRMLSDSKSGLSSEWNVYAKKHLETHLRNFTTIYESLGSDYLSTRFLTHLEQIDNIFPSINYRVFKKDR